MRRIDIETGGSPRVVVLRGRDADAFGINPGDRLAVRYHTKKIIVVADVTHHSIHHGEVGLFEEAWKVLKAKDGDALMIELVSRPESVAAISKKLLGQTLTQTDIRSIIQDIVDRKLSAIETTYFVASGYVRPYTLKEIVWMVKAMAETGDTFQWGNQLVVDKHSVGGLAGNRTTMIAIPIIASLGLIIPKTSSRAITSPAGTADTMEVLAPVSFDADQVRRMVRQNGACIIWGGGLSIAPADDLIIRVSRPLSLEPYDKMIVSIMAKKVAMGIRYLIVDMPYGRGTKIPSLRVARLIEKKFHYVGRAFNIKIKVKFAPALSPIGQGIGPALEARDVLRVLQQKELRPRDLEEKAIGLAADLLTLCGYCRPSAATAIARHQLKTGSAWNKMQQIITAQGGQANIDANQVALGASTYRLFSPKSGQIQIINNRAIDEICRTLGAPEHKLAGLYLHRHLHDRVKRGDKLLTLYSFTNDRIALALKGNPVKQIITIQ